MAVVNHKRCGRCSTVILEEYTKTCPHCGEKLASWASRRLWAIASTVLCIVVLALWFQIPHSLRLKPTVEEQIAAAGEQYAKEVFEGIQIVYKKIIVKKRSRDHYAAAVVVDIPDCNERVLMLEIDRFGDDVTIRWEARSMAALALLGIREGLE